MTLNELMTTTVDPTNLNSVVVVNKTELTQEIYASVRALQHTYGSCEVKDYELDYNADEGEINLIVWIGGN
jgi:hypothetical protein